MVNGVSALRTRFAAIPQKVRQEVANQIEIEAQRLVREMNSLKPIPEIKIDWTWGDAPAGALTLGRVGQSQTAKVAVTIFATGMVDGREFPGLAGWFEFGTKARFHKTGKYTGQISASPYFFPIYRANRQRVRGAISRAVTRGVRKP